MIASSEGENPRSAKTSEPFRWPTSYVGIVHPLAEATNGRERADEFVRFASEALAGASYDDAKAAFKVSHQQAETRKSMLEEMGLLYVPRNSNRVIVTPVGKQLYDLLSAGTPDDALTKKRINAVIAWALSNSQLNRPQSRGTPSPAAGQWESCDIRPYAAGWQAILELDGWLRLDEFFGVLWFTHTVEDVGPAIEAIREVRAIGKDLIDPKRFARDGDLMNPRIYWASHLSSGGTILRIPEGTDRLEVRDESRELLETVLRFAGGCGIGGSETSFRARPYKSVEEYFESVAGRACPEFLFSGSMRVENVGHEPITILEGYKTELSGDDIILHGGPELCSIALNAPCYHKSVPGRLLRLAVKEESPDYQVILKLRRARVFRGTF